MRPPINLRRSARFIIAKLFEEFLNVMFTSDRPVREHGNEKISIRRRLENYGHHISEGNLMNVIVETLPLSWIGAVDKIYHKHNPSTAHELVAWLEEEERELNPLWIDFEQTRMSPETHVRQHMFTKLDLYYKLIRRRYHPHITILVHAIVNTLPLTWPIFALHRELKRNFLDMVNLSKRLESEERKIHPIWRQLLKDEMMHGSSVREHVMLKHSLVGSLRCAGFLVGFSTFIDAVVATLPSWWPTGVIDVVTNKHPLNNDELIIMLEEIEEDAILSKALDEYEAGESSCESHVSCSQGDD